MDEYSYNMNFFNVYYFLENIFCSFILSCFHLELLSTVPHWSFLLTSNNVSFSTFMDKTIVCQESSGLLPAS